MGSESTSQIRTRGTRTGRWPKVVLPPNRDEIAGAKKRLGDLDRDLAAAYARWHARGELAGRLNFLDAAAGITPRPL